MTKVFKIVLPLLVLTAGGFAAFSIMTSRPAARRSQPPHHATPVETVAVEAGPQTTTVRGKGVVMAARTLVVQPEVSGRVIELHPALVAGGRVSEGDVLVRIDPRDYELAMEQQRANIARARFELKVELGRETVAQREWKLLEDDVTTTEAGRALALRKPHIANARAALAAARSGLARAKLNVERTTIVAPFNALVLEEAIEVGQLVAPANRLATLVGTDEFWVQVALPLERLAHIRLPGIGRSEGSSARVRLEAGKERRTERAGRVVRLLGDLDPAGRMARVLVSIAAPLDTPPSEDGGPGLPLLLGAYVTAEIAGDVLPSVYELPRLALRNGDRVWTVDAESKLAIREVDVAWRRRDTVLVAAGLTPGERVIVSPLAAPVAGMEVHDVTRAEPTASPQPPEAAAAVDSTQGGAR